MEEQDEQEVFYFDNDIHDDYDSDDFERVFFGGIVLLLIAIYALLYAVHPRF